MIVHVRGVSLPSHRPEVSMRCPGCRKHVTTDPVGQSDTIIAGDGGDSYVFGLRSCPDPTCRTLVVVVVDRSTDQLLVSYPAETIDFDATNIPEPVVEALDEAIKCHAQQCYVAAAIMIRKTLEELCHERGAAGQTLKARIEALGATVVLPQAMLAGLDELRLLGNDAAHIESRLFNEIGQEEVKVAIDVTKEILKATYQYESIIGRLRALRSTPRDS